MGEEVERLKIELTEAERSVVKVVGEKEKVIDGLVVVLVVPFSAVTRVSAGGMTSSGPCAWIHTLLSKHENGAVSLLYVRPPGP